MPKSWRERRAAQANAKATILLWHVNAYGCLGLVTSPASPRLGLWSHFTTAAGGPRWGLGTSFQPAMTRIATIARELYFGESPRAHRFRYAMLVLDLVMIFFIISSSFFQDSLAGELLGTLFGILTLLDVGARIMASEQGWMAFLEIGNLIDAIVIVSLLAPVSGQNFAFLRFLRSLRLLRSYQTVRRLRQDVPFFRRHQDVILAVVNLLLFTYAMTALVFETQVDHNPEIRNYADALYFTVTALTTTGFGDITMTDTMGRLITVAIMIVGVTLFLRLVQVIIRPSRIPWRCQTCGLSRHENDAIHCRHCGAVLNRPHGD